MNENTDKQPGGIIQTRAEFTLDGLKIPKDTSKVEWYYIHRNAMLCEKAAKKWVKQSREFGTESFGIEHAAQTELVVEYDLFGEPLAVEQPKAINPPDKSRAVLTIEGISQSFSLWQRKMADQLPTFSRDQAQRAVELLEPMAKQYEELKRMIE